MELSSAMNYVMERAKGEASGLFQNAIYPEHVLLGILTYTEMSVARISPPADQKADVADDLAKLSERLEAAHVNTGSTKDKLRRILKAEPPSGDAETLVERLFAAAAKHEQGELLYPGAVLRAIASDPTAAMKAVLPPPGELLVSVKKAAPGSSEPVTTVTADVASGDSVSAAENLPFLAQLTRRIRNMRFALLEKVQGQDHVVHAFAEGMFAAEALAAADTERKRPRAVFVFCGPPGVGKTFLAESAATGLEIPFKRFDMSSYADHQAQVQLIGWAPSYKDAHEGQLTGFVKENPHCILLFDEIEKAHQNTIQLFLQILDAGRLHDDFCDEDIDFKDTIIIFTSNAGRQLYEGKNKYSAAGLPRQTILNALETDINPSTQAPFFPAPICSRMATGYPMMFNHLDAYSLESICRRELQQCSTLFSKQYGISIIYDSLLPTTLLFAEGGQADARSLQAQTNQFFKNEIFKLCRLWGEEIDDALVRVSEIRFTVDTSKAAENVGTLFESRTKTEFLVFGDQELADRLRVDVPEMIAHSADDAEEAFSLLAKNDISMVLLKLVSDREVDKSLRASNSTAASGSPDAFFEDPIVANSLRQGRGFFKELRERMPEIPVYLVESDDFIIDSEMENALIRAGARGKLTASNSDMSIFIEGLTAIAKQLYLQVAAATLAAERKILSFESEPLTSAKAGDPGRTSVNIRLGELVVRRATDANDAAAVLDEAERPKVRFSDVIGAQSAKDELQFFIQYLKNPKTLLAQGLRAPKGVLLYGPPGTGKTLLAKAMAGESAVAFLPTVASAFVTKWQGSGSENVRDLFLRARRYAPSIIFIDEIDAIGRARGGTLSGHGEEMALNALLAEMDGFAVDPKRPVFVLAATNFALDETSNARNVLDPALTRRFDRTILVDLPTKEDRQRYLEYLLQKRGGHQVSKLMAERLASRAAGLTLANLETIMELAARNAAKKNQPLDDELLEEAFEL
ncbi:MAG: AAA family ATPase, partial [Symbiobacteriaceae bacterium]|nr:AAA family ATPase [Symbiobacteriaceae bacterium]